MPAYRDVYGKFYRAYGLVAAAVQRDKSPCPHQLQGRLITRPLSADLPGTGS
jgi:hypothetical protein